VTRVCTHTHALTPLRRRGLLSGLFSLFQLVPLLSPRSTGLSLMMMKPRLERSEQAIAAFERTKVSPTLPDAERENVNKAMAHAQYRLQEGKDSLDMPDMSNCVIA